MCEELQKCNAKEIELPIKNWTNERNRPFLKRKQMDNDYFKVFIIPSHWINANLKYFEIPPHSFRMALIKKSDDRDWRDGSAVKTTPALSWDPGLIPSTWSVTLIPGYPAPFFWPPQEPGMHKVHMWKKKNTYPHKINYL